MGGIPHEFVTAALIIQLKKKLPLRRLITKGTASTPCIGFYNDLHEDASYLGACPASFLLTKTMTTARPRKYKGITINEPL